MMWQNDVRLGQSQGSDRESGRENNAKKKKQKTTLNELFNYLNYQTVKYSVCINYHFYMLLEKKKLALWEYLVW